MSTFSWLRFWTGPLPHQELFPDHQINFLRHWVLHPLKRRTAKYYLVLLRRVFGLRVICITGSAGKTTTANLIASVLSQAGRTVCTLPNVTSTYNLPTTILKANPLTRYLVLEMGVEYPGDMDFYLWLARPDIGVITSVNKTHLQYLGDIKGVAAEKGKLLSALPSRGAAVVNTDDPNISISTSASVFGFGTAASAYSRILEANLLPNFNTRILLDTDHTLILADLAYTGTHFASAAAAAAAVGRICQIYPPLIRAGLESAIPADRRLRPLTLPSGVIILNDSYNANPLAVTAALSVLIDVCKLTSKIPAVVFGQMNELGDEEISAHHQVGLLIKKLKIKHLFTLGPATAHTIRSAGVGTLYPDVASLTTAVSAFLTRDHCLLVKSSRSWQLDRLVDSVCSSAS